MTDAKELYTGWVALWNGNLAGAQDIIAPDFVFHRGNGQPDWRGPDELAQKVQASRAIFSELVFTTEQGPISDGQWLVGRNTASGVYAGGMPGADAEPGTTIELVGIDLLRVANGKIVEAWHNSNDLEFMLQLGLVHS